MRHALHVIERQVWLERSNRSLYAWRQRLVWHRRPYLQHTKLGVLLGDGHVEVGLRILEQESVLAGVRHAQDLDPRPAQPGRPETPTDRVSARPQHIGEMLV